MIKVLSGTLLLTITFAYTVVTSLNHFAENRCYERAVSFDDARWKFTSGCMVKSNGEWLPLQSIRNFNN